MVEEDVIRFAREVGLIDKSQYLFPHRNQIAAMTRFASKIEAEALEKAAQVCYQLGAEVSLSGTEEAMGVANSLGATIRTLKPPGTDYDY
jgi:2-hydroxychromene-2-carboxylate isomerase